MKFYLAGSFSSQSMLLAIMYLLQAMGHEVTSHWLIQTGNAPNPTRAKMDLSDIDVADAVIVFTSIPSTTGGLWVELGYALGIGKPVYLCGPRSNVFAHLVPNLTRDVLLKMA